MKKNANYIALTIGMISWFVFTWLRFESILAHQWAEVILILACLVWYQIFPHKQKPLLVLVAGLALIVSFLLSPGWWAGSLSLGWLAISIWQFQIGVNQLFHGRENIGIITQAIARIFMVVGGIWASLDRFDLQPLGFNKDIVLLTAVHFHFAGLFFTFMAGVFEERFPSKFGKFACWLAIISVPLTAIGITLTQMQMSPLVETVAALFVTISGYILAYAYGGVAAKKDDLPVGTRIAWAVLALCLVGSMSLALGYAIRPYHVIDWLTIPNMRAWHGTLNAFGVAGAGLIGWQFFWNASTEKDKTNTT